MSFNCGLRFIGIRLNVGVHIKLKWKFFYIDKKKMFFVSGLVTTMCRRAGVPFLDNDKALPMDPRLHPLLVR